MQREDVDKFDGRTLGELIGALQLDTFQLGSLATYYKAKVGRRDRKMKDDLEVSNKKAIATEKRSEELNVYNMKLVEQISLFEAKTDDLGRELKASYES